MASMEAPMLSIHACAQDRNHHNCSRTRHTNIHTNIYTASSLQHLGSHMQFTLKAAPININSHFLAMCCTVPLFTHAPHYTLHKCNPKMPANGQLRFLIHPPLRGCTTKAKRDDITETHKKDHGNCDKPARNPTLSLGFVVAHHKKRKFDPNQIKRRCAPNALWYLSCSP